jgi:hypothetical protein
MENFDFRKPEAYKNVNSGSTIKKVNIQNKTTWVRYLRSFF